MTEREDDKTAERWQKDAQVILIFVSPYFPSTLLHTPTGNLLDRLVICRHRGIPHRVHSRHQAKHAGRLRVLSREHLSDSRRPQCT